MFRSVLFCLIIKLLFFTSAYAAWTRPARGQMPPDAVVAGQDGDGQPVYVCRAQHGGGVYPGTLPSSSLNCTISYGGMEYSLSAYEVLSGTQYNWATAFNGEIPFDALPVGERQDEEAIYICRGEVNSSWRVGKIRRRGVCIVPSAGREMNAPWYEVLVGNE